MSPTLRYNPYITIQLMQEVSLGKIIISRPNFNITYSSLKTCLESIDFFNRMLSGLSPFALKNMLGTVAKKLEFREVDAEEVVYGKGDTNKDIYFVITGEVGAFIIVDNVLNEIRNFTELEGFGDAEAVADIHRLFATIAKKPSILALLKPEDFREVLKDYHQKVYQAKFIKFMHNFILGRFTKSQLELIVHNSREVHAIRNQIIYQYGQPSQDMYFIEKGQVKLYREVGRKQIQICVLQEGQLLGDGEVILQHPRNSTAQCVSQTLTMYKISKKLFFSQTTQYTLKGILQILQVKEQKRQQRFDLYSEKRVQVQNPQVRLARISKLLQKGRKLANKRYSQLDDGKVYETAESINFTRKVDRLINKKNRVLQEGYGIQVKSNEIQKHQFFDFAKGLRPRVLHYRSHQLKPKKQKFYTQTGSNEGSEDGIKEIKTISKLFDQQHCYLQFKEPSKNTFRLPTIKKRRLIKQHQLSFQL